MTLNRLLITGAAGTLGHILRGAFAGRFQLLRLSDRSPLGPTGPEEDAITCDLADAASVRRLCEGVNKKYLGVFLQTRSIIEFLLLCM